MCPTNNGSTKDVQPPVVQVQPQVPNSEPLFVSVSASMPNLKPTIPYPSRRNDERRREKANDQIEKFYKIFKDLSFEISLTDALLLMPKFASTLKALIGNKEKLSEMARTPLNEHCSATLMPIPEFPKDQRALIDVYKGELTHRVGKEVITFKLDQTLRYSANYDDMTVNQIDVIEMACDEESTFTGVDNSYYDSEWISFFLKQSLLVIHLPPYSQSRKFICHKSKEHKVCEAKTDKSSIDEPPEVKLKDLPPHLEYAFLEGNNKLPVIIAKDLSVKEKAALLKVLMSHKRAIAWKLSDIKGINLEFCTHKILMEEDYKPAVQHQIRVNPKIHDVIKKEVEKLLDAGLIYPISDSPWVSHVHCVPKKGGFTVVENDENELIPT
ncbi:hypothetical protein Tco_0578056 [Tanacetum coccineum]